MFSVVGSGYNRTCQGATRRELLQVGGSGLLGLTLTDLLGAQAAGAQETGVNCIVLYLWGGPPKHDTWDPKPDAPSDIASQTKWILTNVDGIRIGEMLPRMAKIADRYVLVRSAHTNTDVHGNGCHANLTGQPKAPNLEHPNLGAVVDKFLGPRGAMPAFVTVGPVMTDAPVLPTGQEGGFLGSSYQPFRILDPTAPLDKQPALSLPPGLSMGRLLRRDDLYRRLDQMQRVLETDAVRGRGTAYERAVSLTTAPKAKEAFDLSREANPLRDRYGRTPFGQGCLMARRLIESGVRFVQVNWADHPINNWGFDNHGENVARLKNQLPNFDQACSALIDDLVQRGLYEKTILVVTGEFGRTPKINVSGGRDHWPHVYSFLMGGGGIPGGRVIGESDAQGGYPAAVPVTPEMRAVSIYERMGLDTAVALRKENLVTDSRGIPGLFG